MPDKPYISNEEYVTRLTQVGRWATPGTPIQYAFLEQRPAYLPAEQGWVPFSAAQRAAAYHAFAMIAEVTNVTFQQVSDNQQQPGIGNPRINFYANSVNLNYSGSMDPYYLNETSDIYGADIRLNNARIAQRQAQEGFNDFTSLVALHEIMHAVGLSHPSDYNGQGFNYQDHAEFVQDTIQYSVMSYWAAAEAGADHVIGSTQYVASTPLLFDILALQSLYGPNMATRTGDTVYGFNSNTGQSPFDFAANPAPVIAIWDAGGNDTIDLSGYSTPSLINLNAGEFSDAGSLSRNIAIAFGVTIENAVGGAGNDTLIGNVVANRLEGRGGNDMLDGGAGADHMSGGAGDDRYFVHDTGDSVTEEIGGGTDRIFASISYAIGAGVHVETLSTSDDGGTDSINLAGNELANILYGNAGANILNGGGAADALNGLGGDDSYHVDDWNDVVSEAAGAGTDRVYASISYALGVDADVETLSTLDNAGTAAINLLGNRLANVVYGNAGNNVLNGAGGADNMVGFGGDDSYYVDQAGDLVSETSGGGADRIFASASYTLRSAVQVETLSTSDDAGTAAINLLGNELANVIYGNAGNNVLNGAGGLDSMAGFGGNDSYYVDHVNDVVTEAAGGGSDRIFASASYALGLGLHVETLSTTSNAGTAAINLLGNELANVIYGNAGSNVLNGGGGADNMAGFGGNDNYYVDHIDDLIAEAAGGGADRIFASASYALRAGVHVETLSTTSNAGTGDINLLGNELANVIYGNAGSNVLNGAGGADNMAGLGGNDSYYVDQAGDLVSETSGGGSDRIFASASYTLRSGVHVETLSTTSDAGTAAINLLGNELANALYGNNGANVLNGGLGADAILGLGGADTFAFTTALGGGNIDRIGDFLSGTDRIALDDAVFTGLTTGALADGAFATGSAAQDATDRIIYNPATGALLFDADGSGAGAAVQFATLSTGLALSAADFSVI